MAGTAVDKYKTLIKGCCQTWVLDFNVVYFMGGDEQTSDLAFEKEMTEYTNGKARFIHLPGVREDYISASYKQWLGLVHLIKNDPAAWYCILGTDNYINRQTTVNILEKYNGNHPQVLGGIIQERKVGVNFPFVLGGGGIFINHKAATQIFKCSYEEMEGYARKVFCQNWFDLCVKHQADLTAACDVALCYHTWMDNIPITGEKAFYCIDCNGYQYFQNANVHFHFDKEIIAVCHYMSREAMLKYRFNTTTDKRRIAKILVEDRYNKESTVPSDIYQHIPRLAELASNCGIVAECGVRDVISTWAFIKGLSESSEKDRILYCVDTVYSPKIEEPKTLAASLGVKVQFIQGDSARVDFPTKLDLLFIDTWHIYGHLKRELAKHHANVTKFIAMHDTEVDAIHGESVREHMNVTAQSQQYGYPPEEIMKGLRPAIDEFLGEHPEWEVAEHYINCNGLTILRRIDVSPPQPPLVISDVVSSVLDLSTLAPGAQ